MITFNNTCLQSDFSKPYSTGLLLNTALPSVTHQPASPQLQGRHGAHELRGLGLRSAPATAAAHEHALPVAQTGVSTGAVGVHTRLQLARELLGDRVNDRQWRDQRLQPERMEYGQPHGQLDVLVASNGRLRRERVGSALGHAAGRFDHERHDWRQSASRPGSCAGLPASVHVRATAAATGPPRLPRARAAAAEQADDKSPGSVCYPTTSPRRNCAGRLSHGSSSVCPSDAATSDPVESGAAQQPTRRRPATRARSHAQG